MADVPVLDEVCRSHQDALLDLTVTPPSLRAHLAACAGCREQRRLLEELAAQRTAFQQLPPAELRQRIVIAAIASRNAHQDRSDQITRDRGPASAGPWWLPGPGWGFTLAALIPMIVGLWWCGILSPRAARSPLPPPIAGIAVLRARMADSRPLPLIIPDTGEHPDPGIPPVGASASDQRPSANASEGMAPAAITAGDVGEWPLSDQARLEWRGTTATIFLADGSEVALSEPTILKPFECGFHLSRGVVRVTVTPHPAHQVSEPASDTGMLRTSASSTHSRDLAAVPDRPEGPGPAIRFRVGTPHGCVRVRGTVFEVRVDETGTEVRVISGEVVVEPLNAPALRLPAGQRCRMLSTPTGVRPPATGSVAGWHPPDPDSDQPASGTTGR